jgi:putative cardiolipin synthase
LFISKNTEKSSNRLARGLFFPALSAALLLTACATPLKPVSLAESRALVTNTDIPAWAPLHDNLPGDLDTSWFHIQDVGPEALRWRLAMIDTATASLDAQYFIWKQDAVGSLMMERVLDAADRGIRVRLLLDDSFLSGEEDLMLQVDAHPNIELRIFNPFEVRSSSMSLRYLGNLNDFERTNHRMHNKLLIADGQVAIVGGRNIANEYFDFDEELNFRDFDVMTTGKILPEISNSFDHYWNSGWAYPISLVTNRTPDANGLATLRTRLRGNAASLDTWHAANDNTPESLPSRWEGVAPDLIAGHAHLLEDTPLITAETLPVQAADKISGLFAATDSEVMSISAYLIPSSELLAVAESLTAKGVRIRALTNSLASNNHIPAHTAYRHRRRELLEAGVELYEFRPDAEERDHFEAPGFGAEHVGLHAKILVIDRRLVFVGTINADPRSMVLNTEVSLVIDSPELATAITAAFEADFLPANSWHVTLDDQDQIQWHSADGTTSIQPADSIWQRMGDAFIGILPIDAQM